VFRVLVRELDYEPGELHAMIDETIVWGIGRYITNGMA
jgi:hypothetical protein